MSYQGKEIEEVKEKSLSLSVQKDGEISDESDLEEDEKLPHNEIWARILKEFEDRRKEITDYVQEKSPQCELPDNPATAVLKYEIYPLLRLILHQTLVKYKELDYCTKCTFNGVDYISEMFWNLNPRYPERKKNWQYIFNMDWVEDWLEEHPRPFYPFSWVWSRDYAAKVIQAAMRGYWVRCREDVQEMRQFWKAIKNTGSETVVSTAEI